MDNSYHLIEKEELLFYRARYHKEWLQYYKSKFTETTVDELITPKEIINKALALLSSSKRK